MGGVSMFGARNAKHVSARMHCLQSWESNLVEELEDEKLSKYKFCVLLCSILQQQKASLQCVASTVRLQGAFEYVGKVNGLESLIFLSKGRLRRYLHR